MSDEPKDPPSTAEPWPDEALDQNKQAELEEAAEASVRVHEAMEQVKQYVEERRDSIRRGARLTKHRFRL